MPAPSLPSSDLLTETADRVDEILGPDAARLTVERVVVGLFFTGVKLAGGATGACATPLSTIREAVCCPSSAMAMPFPGKLRGRPARDLRRLLDEPDGIRRAVGVAAMNALSAAAWDRAPHPGVTLRAGEDAYAAAAIQPGERVVVVGAFIPFIKALKRGGQSWTVLENDPATLKPDELAHFRPAAEAPAVVPDADVLLITGTTLLNGTLTGLLALARPEARVVVVGPTVGLMADVLLAHGVDILGGIRVTDPDAFLDILAEGGSGYHFFGRSAEKVVLMRSTGKSRALAA
ncbi:MAG: Rossmann-like domain-containing protein [Acetobacteraceae bacterium]